jgi:hypothetical protein
MKNQRVSLAKSAAVSSGSMPNDVASSTHIHFFPDLFTSPKYLQYEAFIGREGLKLK